MIARVVAGDELRALMRRVPAGVAVVTVDLDGQRAGLTVASLVSLSLEPPLVGVAIRRDAALHELLREVGTFAVSLLAAGPEHLAQHFARGVPPIALWEGIPLRAASGPPQLEGIKIGGRWAVIYSKYDIGCALERHQSPDCLGHDYESAKTLARAVVLYAMRQ